jgi:mRNA interferase MazF
MTSEWTDIAGGDIWLVDLNPVRGHEQAGIRPCAVVSTHGFNRGPAGLLVVLPLTTTDRGIPLHVALQPPEGGVRRRSFIKCEDIRSIARDRLIERWGTLGQSTLAEIADRLRILLEL